MNCAELLALQRSGEFRNLVLHLADLSQQTVMIGDLPRQSAPLYLEHYLLRLAAEKYVTVDYQPNAIPGGSPNLHSVTRTDRFDRIADIARQMVEIEVVALANELIQINVKGPRGDASIMISDGEFANLQTAPSPYEFWVRLWQVDREG